VWLKLFIATIGAERYEVTGNDDDAGASARTRSNE